MTTERRKAYKPSEAALRRYRDIENGKALPTFIEFFQIAIIFEIAENVNLKELYPGLYDDLKKQIDTRKKRFARLDKINRNVNKLKRSTKDNPQ